MKTIKTTVVLTLLTAVLLTSSCSFFGGSAKNREKGTPMESTKSAVEKVLADVKSNEGKRFAITGYLSYSPAMTVYTSRPQTVYVSSTPGNLDDQFATIEMSWKENGHNSVFLDQNAGRDGTKAIFYDHDGKPLNQNDKVVVSFSVNDQSVYLTEARIDRAQ